MRKVVLASLLVPLTASAQASPAPDLTLPDDDAALAPMPSEPGDTASTPTSAAPDTAPAPTPDQAAPDTAPATTPNRAAAVPNTTTARTPSKALPHGDAGATTPAERRTAVEELRSKLAAHRRVAASRGTTSPPDDDAPSGTVLGYGALVGAGVGFTLGALLVASICSGRGLDGNGCDNAVGAAVLVGFVAALGGATSGLLIGLIVYGIQYAVWSAQSHEHARTESLPGDPRLPATALAATRAGPPTQLRLRVEF